MPLRSDPGRPPSGQLPANHPDLLSDAQSKSPFRSAPGMGTGPRIHELGEGRIGEGRRKRSCHRSANRQAQTPP